MVIVAIFSTLAIRFPDKTSCNTILRFWWLFHGMFVPKILGRWQHATSLASLTRRVHCNSLIRKHQHISPAHQIDSKILGTLTLPWLFSTRVFSELRSRTGKGVGLPHCIFRFFFSSLQIQRIRIQCLLHLDSKDFFVVMKFFFSHWWHFGNWMLKINVQKQILKKLSTFAITPEYIIGTWP